MIDYTSWLKMANQPQFLDATPSWAYVLEFIVLLVASTAVLFLMLFSGEGVIASTGAGFVTIVALALPTAFIGGLIFAKPNPAYDPNLPTFTEYTEEAYHIERLRCSSNIYGADAKACQDHAIPDDNIIVEYIKDGQIVEGRLLRDGNKVGITDSDGRLLKGHDVHSYVDKTDKSKE